MQIQMHILTGPQSGIDECRVEVSRLPVLGEYVRHGSEWYEVKRVLHVDGQDATGEIFAIPIVDPTREPIRLYEWLESAP